MNVEQLMELTSKQARVLVVGDLMLDRYTLGQSDRVSPEAPVLVLQAREQEVRLGGAASVAAILRGLGAQVALAGVIGLDPAAPELRMALQKAGIEQELLCIDQTRPTTVKQRFVAEPASRPSQQILRVDQESIAPVPRGIEERIVDGVAGRIADAEAGRGA